jgi:hypothetical protein
MSIFDKQAGWVSRGGWLQRHAVAIVGQDARATPARTAHILVQKKHEKKALIFAQNLESKGSEFFRPARSMVLKVVRGKILETLELPCSPTARGAVLELPMAGAVMRLLKNAIILQITSTFQYYRE